jgi:hypothetical protein
MHQLAMSAQKRWRWICGFKHIAEVIGGVDAQSISTQAA